MKRPNLLILGAWLLQATAWFVPVVKLDKFSLSVPGWEAFLSTASELWLSGDTHFTSWYAAVLSAVSVTTTVVFLAASPWVACVTWPTGRRQFLASSTPTNSLTCSI